MYMYSYTNVITSDYIDIMSTHNNKRKRDTNIYATVEARLRKQSKYDEKRGNPWSDAMFFAAMQREIPGFIAPSTAPTHTVTSHSNNNCEAVPMEVDNAAHSSALAHCQAAHCQVCNALIYVAINCSIC
jgi:hypothetical protein